MSRGEARHRMAVLAIHAHRIEYGLARRQGRGWHWQECHGVAMAAEAGEAGVAGAAALPALQALCDALARLPEAMQAMQAPVPTALRVVVSERWLACAEIPWSETLAQAPAPSLQAHLREQLRMAGHAPAPDDLLAVDDAPYGVPRLVVAHPRPLLDCLQQWAQPRGMRVTSLMALSVAVWRCTARLPQGQRQCALVVVDEGAVVLLRGAGVGAGWRLTRRPRLQSLAVRRLAPQAHGGPAQAVEQAWRRLCLREPAWALLEQVGVADLSGAPGGVGEWAQGFHAVGVGGDGGADGEGDGEGDGGGTAGLALRAGLDAPDGLALGLRLRRPAWALWQWAAWGVLGCVAAGAVLQAMDRTAAVQAAQRQAARQARADQAAVPRSTWGREQWARVPAVNAAIRQLNLPIDALSEALVPPRDIQAAVLGLETSGAALRQGSRASALKLTAQACTAIDMARYVAYVAERRPLTAAYLVHHEMLPASPECPYRFVVEAQWLQ